MSTLFWQEVPRNPEQGTLPEGLKKIIAPRYWGHDGSLNGADLEFGRMDLDYFHGLADAGVEGAQEVIDAVMKYGNIELGIKN